MFAPFHLGEHFEPPLLQQLEQGNTVPVVLKNLLVKERKTYGRSLIIGAECYAEPLLNNRVSCNKLI